MHGFVLIAAVFLSACTTALWMPDYKQERVNGFYVNQETGQLFVTTADTAYIFSIDDDFGETLLLSREVEFYPEFDDFGVDKEHRVTGAVSLRLAELRPSEKLISQLRELGFKEEDVTQSLTLTRELNGRQYVIECELPLEKLEKELVVFVAQPRTFSQTAGKIVATPATIAWDAIVTIPAVFLLVTIMATDSP